MVGPDISSRASFRGDYGRLPVTFGVVNEFVPFVVRGVLIDVGDMRREGDEQGIYPEGTCLCLNVDIVL